MYSAISRKKICSKPTKMCVKSRMSYSESELDFSFANNSSESEFDSNSALINLDICIFFTLYLHSS